MNKNSIKTFAVWARNELITRVTQKAFEYGLEKNNIIDAKSNSINGKLLTDVEKKQRQQLIIEVNNKGFDQVIEEVAYTWFNRFVALRYMEVNNYLPNRIRIFTNENNEFKPQILDEAMSIDLAGLDKELVFNLLESNNQEELYKQLIIATCNDMGNYLPGMFTRISDYKVLLFPDNILRNENILGKLVSDIDEDSWFDQVQTIGWLYQFYNTELKDKVNARSKGQKIHKNDIPAVTQLFTPDWIVKYMVENSLGRLWLNGHPNDSLKSNWHYYLDEAEQEYIVNEKLNKIKDEHSHLKIEKIKVIDPCMGSGHILVYAFEVLMQIYKENGYSERDAAVSILKNNLYGLDIDERAYQLSYFAVMMKARQYNRRILTLNIKPQLYVFEETTEDIRENLFRLGDLEDLGLRIANDFENAKELGSILKINYDLNDINSLNQKLDEIDRMADYGDLFTQANSIQFVEEFSKLVNLATVMSKKYSVVVTNPPYTPISGCSSILNDFAKKYYSDSKTDFFGIFIEKCNELTKKNGYQAMITMHSWMFLSSYEKLRTKLLNNITIVNMAHLGARAFEEIGGEVVQTTAFVLNNSSISDYKGSYKRLVDYNSQDAKEEAFRSEGNCYETSANNFSKIPGSPIAYWCSKDFTKIFDNSLIADLCQIKQGLATCNNDLFLRLWYELDFNKIGLNVKDNSETFDNDYKWFPYNKGGGYRKWYGNNINVVNWKNGGQDIHQYNKIPLSFGGAPVRAKKFYFKPGITYGLITSASFSARDVSDGFIFDVGGSMIFPDSKYKNYLLGLLSTKIISEVLKVINPTLNYQVGDIGKIPVVLDTKNKEIIDSLVEQCIYLSKSDWNSFETSWDFEVHPFVRIANDLWDVTGISASMQYYYGEHIEISCPLELCYMLWQGECIERFSKLKKNEEELNQIFINTYGLQNELTPNVDDKNVTVRKAELTRDIKSFISYAVGCMFGRYSLDVDRLVSAGGEWNDSKYKTFIPDKDNIIPISDDEYFEDDIVERFVKFVETVYGKETLDANLKFIADALNGKGTPRKVIRQYFLNDFFKDHCNTYQVTGSGKRPIYWLFDSGKKNGFKALVYIHRYKPDLIARMRTQYIHEQQVRYRNQIEMLENQINGGISTSERVRLNKKLKTLKEQDEELRKYEERIHHWADKMEPMDLDDGVKANYAKFQELLAKIK